MYVSAHTHVLMYTMHACRCKNTCICTYMHMFICTHVYLYTQIFLYTRVHACVCTHTQKIGLWITEYPKALPRNEVKFKEPSYTQKRLFWKGTQEPRRTEKGRRNIMSFSLKENKAHSWNFLKKEFYPQVADLEDIFTHVNEISLSISCLEVATTLDETENSQVFSPELLMQTETQAHHPHKCSSTFGVASKMEARYQILCQFLWNDKTGNTWKLFKHLTNFISTTNALKLNSGFWNRLFSDLRMWKMCGDKEEYADLRIEVWTAVQAWYS